MTAKRAVMLVKKVTYFGEFGYLSSFCIRKSIILMFLSPSRDQFTSLQKNSVINISVGFQHHCAHLDEPQHGVSIQISVNLGIKFLRKSYIRKIAVT